jgi:hypothetical protein
MKLPYYENSLKPNYAPWNFNTAPSATVVREHHAAGDVVESDAWSFQPSCNLPLLLLAVFTCGVFHILESGRGTGVLWDATTVKFVNNVTAE